MEGKGWEGMKEIVLRRYIESMNVSVFRDVLNGCREGMWRGHVERVY